MSHVIAAVSTGNQISAIGILRLTGDGCADVAGKVFQLNNGMPFSALYLSSQLRTAVSSV